MTVEAAGISAPPSPKLPGTFSTATTEHHVTEQPIDPKYEEKHGVPFHSNTSEAPKPSIRYQGRGQKLKPSLLIVHDIGLESLIPGKDPRLEINEILPSTFPSLSSSGNPKLRPSAKIGSNPRIGGGVSRIEGQKIKDLEDQYGWLQTFRLPQVADEKRQCRWIHISSKFPENLPGVLLGLSDWTSDPDRLIQSLRQLDRCVYENERYSKHGKYFSPFFQPLHGNAAENQSEKHTESTNIVPLFMSIPFLDWTVYPGPPPPLRFQVDEREGFFSSKSSCHTLRSLLQYYYRLEDTADRERTQVFTRHRPWQNDRGLDLKVRRWYGIHPTGLNVDELWLLVIDSQHIVTFSSNQSWKSRWPPLQLMSRVAEVSFRGMRDHFFTSGKQKYTSMTHLVATVHGAVGMIHRSFWADMPLPCTDRYAGYIGHLQFRLHRHATTKLVMELLQVQDELTIILQLSRRQAELVAQLRHFYRSFGFMDSTTSPNNDNVKHMSDGAHSYQRSDERSNDLDLHAPLRAHHGIGDIAAPAVSGLQRNLSFFLPTDPLDELVDHLQREIDDITELHANSNELVTRTVQLVNIRLEDHGQAILVFTAVTVLFLPLNFVTSFFGMNTSDIRTMGGSQGLFWIAACALTIVVMFATGFIAFYGPRLKEAFVLRREAHSSRSSSSSSLLDAFDWRPGRASNRKPPAAAAAVKENGGFVVLDAGKIPAGVTFPRHHSRNSSRGNKLNFRANNNT